MKPFEIVLSVLITITLGLTGFMLKWMFVTNAELATTRERMSLLLADTARDVRQDKQLGHHWKLHSWSKSRINELRVASSLPLSEWPNLD
jgi:hypothetical protein